MNLNKLLDKIEYERDLKQISVIDLSKKIGITRQYYYHIIKSDDSDVGYSKIKKLAENVGLKIDIKNNY